MKFLKKNLFVLVAALLALVAVIMFCAPAVGVKDHETTYSGFQIIFGYKQSVLGGATELVVFEFSFMYLLGWLFILLSLLVLVASLFVKKLNIGLIKLLTGFNLIVGGIFCFLAVPFSKVGQGFESLFAAFGADPKSGLVLSAGAIVAGILSFLAGVIVIAEPYLKKLFK